MKKQEYIPNKEQDKTLETDLNKMEITNLPDREFKITVMKMLTEVRRTMMNKMRISTKRQKILKSTKQKSLSWTM